MAKQGGAMQYKVPQNIDQEDKILGPLTFTQFVYALIGGGLLLFEYSLFDTVGFLLFGIPTLLLTIAFSLIKVQDQPFTRFFVSLLVFLKQPKQRIWQDENSDKPTKPLGKDFMADVNRDNPSAAKDNKTAPPLDPLVTAPPTGPTAPTVLTIATEPKNEPIPTASATIAPPAPPTPTKPARKLQVKTNKGAA